MHYGDEHFIEVSDTFDLEGLSPARLNSMFRNAARISAFESTPDHNFIHDFTAAGIEGPVNCCAPSPIRLSELLSGIEAATGKRAVLSPEGEPSPFGIESDWYMDAAKAGRHGFRAAEIREWLPGLLAAALQRG